MTSNLPLVIIIVSINPFLVMDKGGETIYPKAQSQTCFQRQQAQQGSNSLEGSKQVGDVQYCKIGSLLKGLTDVCF